MFTLIEILHGSYLALSQHTTLGECIRELHHQFYISDEMGTFLCVLGSI